jgi:hypothetical protein
MNRQARFKAARLAILREGDGREADLLGPQEQEIRVYWVPTEEKAGILADLVSRPKAVLAAPVDETAPVRNPLAGHWRIRVDPLVGPPDQEYGTLEYPIVDPIANAATGIVGFDLEGGAKL